MKKVIFIIATLHCISSYSQRYLTDNFLELDSIIAGVYGTSVDYQSNNQELLFDFYEPANDTETERPLLIYVHGGGFNTGTRTYPSVREICRRMATKGYAVANIDYRLDPNFDIYNSNTDRRAMTDAMHDAKQAIRYFKANASTFGIDTSLIFIGGESAGAATSMMASFVNKQSEMTAYPMAVPNDPTGSTVNSDVGNNVKGTLCLCGLLLDTLAMEFPTDPPILWTHGTEDNFVPISLAFNIVLRAANIGLPIQAKAYEGAVHCPWFFGNPNSELYLDSTIVDITNFLYPQVLEIINDVEEYDESDNISIYPNPFDSKLYVDLSAFDSKSTIKIISDTGQVLFIETNQRNQNKLELNLEKLEAGIYFLIIENGSSKIIKRILKVSPN